MSKSFWCYGLCLIATIALCAGEDISYKEKLASLIKEEYDGVATFDNTISESVAKAEYVKYTNGEYARTNEETAKIHKLKLSIAQKEKQKFQRSLIESDFTFETADKEEILQIHNDYREALCSQDGSVKDINSDTYPRCSNMNYLFWDNALEKVAQGWADSLASSCGGISHNGNRDSDLQTYSSDASFTVPSNAQIGENVAYTGSSGSASISFVTDRLDDMWEEYGDWSYQTYESNTINGAGHFAQIAWAKTRYVSCAGAMCTSGSLNKYYTV